MTSQRVLYTNTVQGEAYRPCSEYSDCTEFDRSIKPIAIPHFRPRLIRKKYFELRETPHNSTFMGGWVWKIVIRKGRTCDTSFKRSMYPHHFGKKVKRVLNYRHPYVQGTPQCENIGTQDYCIADILSGGYKIFQNYSQHTL